MSSKWRRSRRRFRRIHEWSDGDQVRTRNSAAPSAQPARKKRKKRGVERLLAYSEPLVPDDCRAAHDGQQISCAILSSCTRRSKRLRKSTKRSERDRCPDHLALHTSHCTARLHHLTPFQESSWKTSAVQSVRGAAPPVAAAAQLLASAKLFTSKHPNPHALLKRHP